MTSIPLLEQMLVVSTAHLVDEDEMDRHPMAYALSAAGGWLLVVDSSMAGYYENLGDGARQCIALAQEQGCEFIRFDPNGPVMEGIPTYEWPEPTFADNW